MNNIFKRALLLLLSALMAGALGCADFQGEDGDPGDDGKDGLQGDPGPIGPSGIPCEEPYCVNVNSDDIALGSIIGDQIADYNVGRDKIALGAINTPQLADYAVTFRKLANLSVDTQHINFDSITTDHIYPYTITADDMDLNSVGTGNLQNGSVTDAKIESVSGTKILGDIPGSKIIAPLSASVISGGTLDPSLITQVPASSIIGIIDLANLPSIPGSKLVNLSVEDGKIISLSAGKITGQLTMAQLPATIDASVLTGVIDGDLIDSLPGSKITGTISGTLIDSLPGSKITGTIDASMVNIININASNINTGTIDGSLIDSITQAQISGTIDGGKITSETITTTQILNGTITASDLGTDSVNSDEIADNAVLANHVSPGELTHIWQLIGQGDISINSSSSGWLTMMDKTLFFAGGVYRFDFSAGLFIVGDPMDVGIRVRLENPLNVTKDLMICQSQAEFWWASVPLMMNLPVGNVYCTDVEEITTPGNYRVLVQWEHHGGTGTVYNQASQGGRKLIVTEHSRATYQEILVP